MPQYLTYQNINVHWIIIWLQVHGKEDDSEANCEGKVIRVTKVSQFIVERKVERFGQ